MEKWRFRVILTVFIFLYFAVIARLFYWQVVKGQELALAASSQHRSSQIIEAPRGEIFANDGTWLVARGELWNIVANPKEVEEKPNKVAEQITSIIVDKSQENYKTESLNTVNRISDALNKSDLYWSLLQSRVNPENKDKIVELKIKGIDFEKEESRSYPESSASAHLLGFLGKDDNGENVGYFGLEGYYDDMLSGKRGYTTQDSDAGGVPILFGNFREVKSIKGMDLITSIDKYIQLTAEKKLHEGMVKYGASSGTVIIANPINGEIYAMASLPSFDPGKYWDFGNSYFINPSVSQSFEPGSVFKVVVMASGLDAGVVKPDTKCDICDRPLNIDKYFVKTWNNQYNANSTMTDVIVHSDNVGMSFVGRRLGKDKLYDYIEKFGFGKITGIDLQGESSPPLRKKSEWREIDTATASFGQGIAVTPIQMIKAVSAIANGGVIVKPHVVTKFRNETWEYENETTTGERVISEEAAKEITAMMVEAVKSGESKWTYLRGFKVAGKTGTAQIPIEGHYDAEKTIASFIGFAPYDNPKFVMLITLREPKSSPWASETAAPLWFSIAKDLFIYFGIQPEN